MEITQPRNNMPGLLDTRNRHVTLATVWEYGMDYDNLMVLRTLLLENSEFLMRQVRTGRWPKPDEMGARVWLPRAARFLGTWDELDQLAIVVVNTITRQNILVQRQLFPFTYRTLHAYVDFLVEAKLNPYLPFDNEMMTTAVLDRVAFKNLLTSRYLGEQVDYDPTILEDPALLERWQTEQIFRDDDLYKPSVKYYSYE